MLPCLLKNSLGSGTERCAYQLAAGIDCRRWRRWGRLILHFAGLRRGFGRCRGLGSRSLAALLSADIALRRSLAIIHRRLRRAINSLRGIRIDGSRSHGYHLRSCVANGGSGLPA